MAVAGIVCKTDSEPMGIGCHSAFGLISQKVRVRHHEGYAPIIELLTRSAMTPHSFTSIKHQHAFGIAHARYRSHINHYRPLLTNKLPKRAIMHQSDISHAPWPCPDAPAGADRSCHPNSRRIRAPFDGGRCKSPGEGRAGGASATPRQRSTPAM